MILMVLGVIGGLLMMLVGSLMFLIAAFGVSIWWGLFCIFFPPTNVLFLLTNWKAAKKAFLVIVIGFMLVLIPIVMVENFFTSMRDVNTMHFRSFSQSSSTSTTTTTTIVPPTLNMPMIVPDQKAGPDIVGPQSATGLPELPDQKK